jgi:L-asparaginase
MSKNGRRILVIYTGGTIGMVRDESTGALQPLDIQYLRSYIPEIEHIGCEVSFESFSDPIDSSHIQPHHWITLVKLIEQTYDSFDGFVILHGSDTIAYTASALSFMLENLQKPVILTGAQLPIGIPRSDARENLITSIEIAAAVLPSGLARVPEVAVYFEFNLHRGNRVFKYSTQDFDAFKSANYPILAKAGVHLKFFDQYIRKPSEEKLLAHTFLANELTILPLFPGIPIATIQATLAQPKLKVCILQTFGSGNAPADSAFTDLLVTAIESGITIVNVSQCRGGAVEMGKYAASKHLEKVGVVSAGDMTLEAVICKMMYLLGRGFSKEILGEFFQKDLRGELTLVG